MVKLILNISSSKMGLQRSFEMMFSTCSDQLLEVVYGRKYGMADQKPYGLLSTSNLSKKLVQVLIVVGNLNWAHPNWGLISVVSLYCFGIYDDSCFCVIKNMLSIWVVASNYFHCLKFQFFTFEAFVSRCEVSLIEFWLASILMFLSTNWWWVCLYSVYFQN